MLGTGWAAGAPWGLTPATVIQLQWNAGGAAYTEDGTLVANGIYNRLWIGPANRAATFSTNIAGVAGATPPIGAAWTSLGVSITPTTSLADYTWNSVWTRNPTSYVVNGFTPGSIAGFMTGPNLCINPTVFSAYMIATEQEWANAQMALRGLHGFPNCIQVTLGQGFTGVNGLNPGDVIQLRRVLATVPFRWTEDGTDNPNATTNRLAFQPTGTPGGLAADVSCGTTGPTSWINVGNRGVSGAAYTWHDVWDMTIGFVDSFNTAGGFLTSLAGYNSEVFLAIEYCGGAGWDPRNSPDLIMMKRAP